MSCGHGCCASNREHWLSVGFSASAMPSRKASAAATNARETVLSKDMDAYQRLRRDGVQPKRIDGCAAVEKVARSRSDIEGGPGCS